MIRCRTRIAVSLVALCMAGQCFAYYGRQEESPTGVQKQKQNQTQKRLVDLQRAIYNDAFGICQSSLSSRDKASVRWLLEDVSAITPRVMHTVVLLDDKIDALSACALSLANK